MALVVSADVARAKMKEIVEVLVKLECSYCKASVGMNVQVLPAPRAMSILFIMKNPGMFP